MRKTVKAFWILAMLVLAAASSITVAASADEYGLNEHGLNEHALDEHGSIVIVFKDGHRQNLDIADIARIDFKAPAAVVFKDGRRPTIPAADIERIEFENSASASGPSRNHFVGKWEVGDGNGSNFYITLEDDGEARKTRGSSHGTWMVVDGEARVSWDDGWHDAIRKVGAKHEKLAYEPGKSFSDTPSNVTSARNTEPKPI